MLPPLRHNQRRRMSGVNMLAQLVRESPPKIVWSTRPT